MNNTTTTTSLVLRASLLIAVMIMMVRSDTNVVVRSQSCTATSMSSLANSTVESNERPYHEFTTDYLPVSAALIKARSLQTPLASTITNGEMENLQFWETHGKLLQRAWKEWWWMSMDGEKRTNEESLEEELMIDSDMYQRVHRLWKQPTVLKEELLQNDLWEQPIRNVYTCQRFLSPSGIQSLRRHLRQMVDSGIPTRRPNGMNRRGVILDSETLGGVSYPAIDSFQSWLVDTYVRPLGRMFFPDSIGVEDDTVSYAFTIHYITTTTTDNNQPRDVKLKEHTDASVVTMNINLNLYEEDNYEGSSLLFLVPENESNNTINRKTQQRREALQMKPGMAVLHRGQHFHQALPIEKGQRHQLIVWLFGKNGYVRIAPYQKEEQMSVQERWSKPRDDTRLEFHL